MHANPTEIRPDYAKNRSSMVFFWREMTFTDYLVRPSNMTEIRTERLPEMRECNKFWPVHHDQMAGFF